ncbi:MAG TPA: DJ-1/PfpI family protein [Solirubrobacteraceae bacterium]
MCTGAFALAAAGLLDGRPATTHWRWTEELQRRYPRVEVLPNRLFVDDGDVLTSAGVATGIDLCLHLVRRDHGAAAANTRARALVAPPQRQGGQAQFIERLRPEDDAPSPSPGCSPTWWAGPGARRSDASNRVPRHGGRVTRASAGEGYSFRAGASVTTRASR